MSDTSTRSTSRFGAAPATPGGSLADDVARVLDWVPDPVLVADADTWRLTFVNRRAAVLFGRRQAGTLVGRELWEALPGFGGEGVEQLCREARAAGRALVLQRDYAPAGRAFEMDLELVDGSLFVHLRDVTARRATEDDLRRHHSLLHAVAEGTIDAVYVKDRDGRYLMINGAGARLAGREVGEIIGRDDSALFDAASVASVRERDRLARDEGATVADDTVLTTLDGTTRAFHSTRFPWRNENGEIVGVIGVSRDVTERARAAEAMRASEERYRLLVERSPEAIAVHCDGVLAYANRAAARLVGLDDGDQLVGVPLFDLIHPDDHVAAREALAALGAGALDARTEPSEYRLRRRDGRFIQVEVVSVAVTYNGRPAGQSIVRDVTEQRRAEAAVRAAEQRARTTAERMRAVAAAAAGVLAAHSEQALQKVLHDACESIMRFDLFSFGTYDAGAHALRFLADPWRATEDRTIALTGRPSERVVRDRRSLLTLSSEDTAAAGAVLVGDGRRSESTIRTPILDGDQVLGVLSVQSYLRDAYGLDDVEVLEALAALAATALRNIRLVGEIRRSEERLAHQAYHDPLTNLVNRTRFLDRVRQALLREAPGAGVAVLFLDLDNFKKVNDSLGHSEGDRLLVAAADRLLNATRGRDTVARLGGDEFAVLLEGVRHDADVEVVAGRITTALAAPFALESKEVFTSASVGIALAEEGASAEELLRDADAAMYAAKTQGKGRSARFEPAMHAAMMARLELEADLRRAIAEDQFTLRYQPILELHGGRLAGAETLLRWEHPTRGTLAPADFIGLAEETGLIVEIGRWVLVEACRQGARWIAERSAEGGSFAITVNLSGRQLREASLVGDIRQALDDAGLPATSLVLEMTESIMLEHTDATLQTLNDIRAMGVRLAVDDFGTGYSSLSYLHKFPVDMLKIDKGFVEVVGATGGPDSALARAIISLGETLGLQTVAEGIEHERQAEGLRALGCVLGQGYHLGVPMAPAEITRLLDRGGDAGRPQA